MAPGSACVDGGIEPGDGDGFALTPSAHYAHPASFLSRASVGNIDIGAYELGGDGEPAGGMSNGGGGSARGGAAGVGPGAPGTGGALAGTHGGGQSNTAGSPNPNRAGASGADDTSTRDADCGCRLVAAPNAGRGRLGLASLLGLAAASAVRRRR